MYFGVGLVNPKHQFNIAAALRAAYCFEAAMVAVSGVKVKRNAADVFATHRFLPLLHVNDIKDAIPYDCVPVAIEIADGAIPLHEYKHPERAFYIFGPETGSLGKHTYKHCRDIVYIPTRASLNLGQCVNVVLYDRMAKMARGQIAMGNKRWDTRIPPVEDEVEEQQAHHQQQQQQFELNANGILQPTKHKGDEIIGATADEQAAAVANSNNNTNTNSNNNGVGKVMYDANGKPFVWGVSSAETVAAFQQQVVRRRLRAPHEIETVHSDDFIDKSALNPKEVRKLNQQQQQQQQQQKRLSGRE